MRIGIITNLNSRRNRRGPREIERLRGMLGTGDRLEATAQVSDLPAVLASMRDDGIEVLGLHGGDGTNYHTLSAALQLWGDHPFPRVAFLRGGTMNTVSNSFGGWGTPVEVLRAVLSDRAAGVATPIVERRPLMARVGNETHYAFIFGCGVVSNFLEAYYTYADPSPTVAALVLSRGVAASLTGAPFAAQLARPIVCHVQRDGAPWVDGSFLTILASTQAEVGLGFTPFPRCAESLDHFQVLTFDPPLTRVARLLPSIRLGRDLVDEGVRSELAREITIHSDTPVQFMLDGDFCTAPDGLQLGLGPLLRILVPRR